jgi:hypothetical protein
VWLDGIVVEEMPSVGGAIGKLDVEALFLMRTLKFWVHERAVRDSRRWLRPST